jgi:cytochrome c
MGIKMAVVTAIVIAAGAMMIGHVSAQSADAPSGAEFYSAKVRPVFQQNCFRCHNAQRSSGGLDLTTKAGIMKGGTDGAAIVPGNAANSLLVKLINHTGPDGMPGMPMGPNKLSDDDIATVTKWIADGAAMPDDAPPAATTQQ